jgi:putative oxidoreductase
LGYAPVAPLTPLARQGNTAFAFSVALLVIRLMLGWTFVFHGCQKIFGIWGGTGLEGFAYFLSQLSLPKFLPPMVWACLAAFGELLGGISILLGLLARLGAIPIMVSMFVAIAQVHSNQGYSPPNGYEFNLNLVAMAAAILIAGPGMISVDALIFKRGLWARGAQPLSDPVKRE